MKRFIFLLIPLSFLFLLLINRVNGFSQVNTCNDSIIITIDREWILLKDSEMPDFLSGVTATNPCDRNDVISLSVDLSFLDLHKEGVYKIFYIGINRTGLYSVLPVTVSVKNDIEPPLINGVVDLVFEVDTDIDSGLLLQGVTATDAYDGDITDKIVVLHSNLNPHVLGEYIVTYSVTDNNQNTTSQTITVRMVDTIAPSIELENESVEIAIFSLNINWLNYVIISDNYDDSPLVTIDSSNVDINNFGIYEVIFTASDEAGNVNSKTLTVEVVDNLAPVLIFTNSFIDVFTEGVDYLSFISVSDNYCLNPVVEYDASHVNLSIIGSYVVRYTATDNFGNVNEKEFTINVVDTIPPKIENLTDFEVMLNSELPDFLNGITIVDNYDGIIPREKAIIYDKLVNLSLPGMYYLYYDVTDSSGNHVNCKVVVRVYEDTLPEFQGLHNFKLSYGSIKPDYLSGISAIDNFDGDITHKIIIDESLIDYETPGVYILTYIISDSSGNMTTERVLLQIGIDTEAPQITGLTPLIVSVNSENIDYETGVEAIDDYDVVTFTFDDSLVDITKTGTYYVLYSSKDNTGNKLNMIREITVVDDVIPEFKNVETIVMFQGAGVDLLKKVEAYDNYDGDLRDRIRVIGDYNINKPGKYTLYYEVTDNSGNIATALFILEIRPSYILLIGSFLGGIVFLGLLYIPYKIYKTKKQAVIRLK